MNGQLDLLALAVMAWEAVSGFLHSDLARDMLRYMLYFLLGQWLVRIYIRIGNARVAPPLEELREHRSELIQSRDALRGLRSEVRDGVQVLTPYNIRGGRSRTALGAPASSRT
jgi:hypothetical protein